MGPILCLQFELKFGIGIIGVAHTCTHGFSNKILVVLPYNIRLSDSERWKNVAIVVRQEVLSEWYFQTCKQMKM